jgi:ATP-dependent DNA helicase RecQ
VLRQLVALGHVRAEGEYNTLALTAERARGAARRGAAAAARAARRRAATRAERVRKEHGAKPPPLPLDDEGLARFTAALKAWRAEVAREHNLPAYVVFHDATLAEMAREAPDSLDALAGISGVGAKKLEAYGAEILRVLAAPAGRDTGNLSQGGAGTGLVCPPRPQRPPSRVRRARWPR